MTGRLLRETRGEVVLVSRLRTALERLNPALLPEAITAAVTQLACAVRPCAWKRRSARCSVLRLRVRQQNKLDRLCGGSSARS